MKFVSLKENLSNALAIAEKFAGKNATLPVLGGVLLEVKGSILKISSTNLESAVEVTLSGGEAKDGSVCVPAKVLSQLLQSFRGEKISLEAKQGNLVVTAESKTVRMNGMEAGDFPLIPKVKKSASFELSQRIFQSGLGIVLAAASTSEFKPELNGVYIGVAGKQLALAATDTFRLAEKIIDLKEKADGGTTSFIVPYRVGQEVARMRLGVEGDTLVISVGENQAVLEAKGVVVTTRLVDGKFPDYRGVIPKDFIDSVYLPRDEFMDVVRASSIFSSKLQEVRMHFKGKELSVSSSNTEVGEYRTALPLPVAVEETTLAFNYRYLLDGLSALAGDEVFFGVGGTNKPSLLRDREDDSFLYVIMPMQTV